MRIVNTFISDTNEVPEYTRLSLQKAREKNPTIDIDFICLNPPPYFDELQINWIPQRELENSQILIDFNKVCDFKRHGTPKTTYPSPDLFWHRTAERIFYLQEYLSKNNLDEVFHFENDVLIYHDLNLVNTSDDKITVTDMSPTHTTFAFCYISKYKILSRLCEFFNDALSFGEQKLMTLGYDHISEMSLLNIALRNKMVESFPTLINNSGEFIYDPGSYGQYFGGTNNGHDKGFTDPTHYIGRAISLGQIKPVLRCGLPETEKNKIFNLHIHSKNLQDFI